MTDDGTRDFGRLEAAVRRFRDEREWKRFHPPKDLAVSVAIEAAELLEHFQWRSDAEVAEYLADPARVAAVGRELADVQMLLLSAADAVGVDLFDATLEKLAETAARYPVDRARGTARKYDQL
jgi:dCTP diphosphatase